MVAVSVPIAVACSIVTLPSKRLSAIGVQRLKAISVNSGRNGTTDRRKRSSGKLPAEFMSLKIQTLSIKLTLESAECKGWG
jgi:hypothetical protein